LKQKGIFILVLLLQIIPGIVSAQDYLLINNTIHSGNQEVLYSDSCNAHTALKSSFYFEGYTKRIADFDNPVLLDKDSISWFKRKLLYEHFGVVKTDDYVLIISPLLDLEYSRDFRNNESNYWNTRGALIYGSIGNRLSFSTEFYETQASFPDYIDDYYQIYGVIPGQPRVKPYGTNAYDWGSAFGSVTFKATNFLHFQLGTDKNFIGDGYRSFMLSDYAPQYLYFKTNVKLGRFFYQNLLMSTLNPNFNNVLGTDENWSENSLYDKKTISIGYLGVNVTDWLQFGLFEAVVFGRYEEFINALNPIPLIRRFQFADEYKINNISGLNINTKLQNTNIYGQLVFNREWEIATQLGVKLNKTIGGGGIFAQLEYNYNNYGYDFFTHNEVHYGHYNQALAHPGGNGFNEVLVNASCQYKRWYISASAVKIWYMDRSNGTFLYGGDFIKPIFAFAGEVFTAKFEPAFIINQSYNLMAFASLKYYNQTLDRDYLIVGFGLKTALRNKYHDF
jgi:hypothetical protein